MKRILIFMAFLLLVVGSFIGYQQYNKEHADLANIQADHRLTSANLFQEFASDENQANLKYLDKVLEIRGKISKVEKGDDGLIQIYLEGDDPMFGVICALDPTIEDIAPNWTPGSEISLKGLCSGYLMDVAVNRCVVVE